MLAGAVQNPPGIDYREDNYSRIFLMFRRRWIPCKIRKRIFLLEIYNFVNSQANYTRQALATAPSFKLGNTTPRNRKYQETNNFTGAKMVAQLFRCPNICLRGLRVDN